MSKLDQALIKLYEQRPLSRSVAPPATRIEPVKDDSMSETLRNVAGIDLVHAPHVDAKPQPRRPFSPAADAQADEAAEANQTPAEIASDETPTIKWLDTAQSAEPQPELHSPQPQEASQPEPLTSSISQAERLELTKTTLRMDGPRESVAAPHYDVTSRGTGEQPKPPTSTMADAAADQGNSPADEATESVDVAPAPSDAITEEVTGPTEKSLAVPASAAAQEETPTEQPKQEYSPWNPAWEVDRFQWPDECELLLSNAAEGFADATQQLLSATDGQCVAIAGNGAGVGRTTVTLSLARCLAEQGVKTLLIDANFAAPRVAGSLGLNAPCSWNDAVSSDTPLEEVTVTALECKLDLLPLQDNHRDHDLTLSAKPADAILRRAVATYDIVLVDVGSVEGLSACQNAVTTTAVIVHDARMDTTDELAEHIDELTAAGLQQVFIVENFAKPNAS